MSPLHPKVKGTTVKKTLLTAALALSACTEKPEPTVAPLPKVAVLPVEAKKPDAGHLAVVEPVQAPLDTVGLAHDQQAVDHLARAKGLEASGDYGGALAESRRAAYSFPTDPETLSTVARLAKKAKAMQVAADAYARLAEVQVDDAQPLIGEARVLLSMKQYGPALTAARGAIARDSGQPEAFQAAGRACLSMDDLPCAISSFEKAVSLAPEHGYALNNLGLAYLRANENAKAVDALEKAAEVLPSVAYVQNNLGVAYERAHRTDEAKQAFLTATTLSPKYVKAQLNAERLAKAPTTGDVEPEVEFHPGPDVE